MPTSYDTEGSVLVPTPLTLIRCEATFIRVAELLMLSDEPKKDNIRDLKLIAESFIEELEADYQIIGPIMVTHVALFKWEGLMPEEVEYNIEFYTTPGILNDIIEFDQFAARKHVPGFPPIEMIL